MKTLQSLGDTPAEPPRVLYDSWLGRLAVELCEWGHVTRQEAWERAELAAGPLPAWLTEPVQETAPLPLLTVAAEPAPEPDPAPIGVGAWLRALACLVMTAVALGLAIIGGLAAVTT